jgi:hypothetical protein
MTPMVSGTATGYTVTPTLPAGVTFNSSTGVISGTPTTQQPPSKYTITASNAVGSTSFDLSLTVNPAAPSGLSYPSPVTVVVGQAMQVLNPTIVGFVGTYSIMPALPPGITLDASSGVIAGTPTSVSQQQTYTITAANVTGNTTFTFKLTALAIAANAGPSQTVELGSFVSLDGSASTTSSGDALVFSWSFAVLPSGSEAGLAATSSMQPVFRADKLGTYTVALTVSDNAVTSAPATVDILVVPKVARVIAPPASGSIPVTTCGDIVTPGNYELTADLVAAAPDAHCLSIHDTSNVTLHCNGHSLSDAADYSSVALDIRNVRGFTLQDCLITTDYWQITDSGDVHILDSHITELPNIQTQASIWVWRTPRLRFEFNTVSDVALQMLGSDDAVVADNQFAVTPGAASRLVSEIGSQYAANVQILRNEMDGGWDGVTLYGNFQNEVDDAVVLKDANNALVQNNYMKNCFDTGVEWVGQLQNSVIEGNVIVNVGYAAIGGWYWSSVSNVLFLQNLADRPVRLFAAFRVYGLRPANFDTNVSSLPADTGVYFRHNLFDGNVMRSERSSTFTGGETANSIWMLLYDRMGYGGELSTLPGEVVPTDSQFDVTDNKFVRNDFGHSYPAYFGASPVVPGVVVDGGQNLCVPPPGVTFPLACE